jgi:hypothetical protein
MKASRYFEKNENYLPTAHFSSPVFNVHICVFGGKDGHKPDLNKIKGRRC